MAGSMAEIDIMGVEGINVSHCSRAQNIPQGVRGIFILKKVAAPSATRARPWIHLSWPRSGVVVAPHPRREVAEFYSAGELFNCVF